MKLTLEPIVIRNKYFFEIHTMFGDADLYKDFSFEVASEELTKTILEFLAFVQAPNQDSFYCLTDSGETEKNFKWLEHYHYEYDLDSYGRLQNYQLIYYNNEGQKFNVTISEAPNFNKLLKNVSEDDYPQKAIELIENLMLKEKLDETLGEKKKAKKVKV